MLDGSLAAQVSTPALSSVRQPLEQVAVEIVRYLGDLLGHRQITDPGCTLVPTLAVSVRRLHDTGRSGWWMLLSLVPFGGIVLLVFDCLDSEPGPNRFGPSPKQLVGGPAWPQQPPAAFS